MRNKSFGEYPWGKFSLWKSGCLTLYNVYIKPTAGCLPAFANLSQGAINQADFKDRQHSLAERCSEYRVITIFSIGGRRECMQISCDSKP